MSQKITLTIPANDENTALLGLCIKGLHSLINLSQDEHNLLYLCITEAVNNVIEHSIIDHLNSIVSVKLSFRKNKITIIVINKGKSMNPDVLQNIKPPNIDHNDIQNLPERGYGLYIINTYMDKIKYRQQGNNNYFLMVKQLRM